MGLSLGSILSFQPESTQAVVFGPPPVKSELPFSHANTALGRVQPERDVLVNGTTMSR